MTDLMKIVLALTVSGTALAAALALLRRVLKDKLPKTVVYYLWLLVLLRLIVPVALPVPGLERALEPPAVEVTPPFAVQAAPDEVVGQPIVIDPSYIQTAPHQTASPDVGEPQPVQPPKTPWYQSAWTFLCDHFAPIWLTGAAVHFLWFAVSYFRFTRGLDRDCAPLLEHEQALLDNLRGNARVEACRSPLAQTPMLLGLIRPRIVLPQTPITTRELECILRHELTHLSRRDLLYKWFTVAVTSVHWFNPLMPWLRREISRCCELSCDEGVIREMDDQRKQLYGETLLALAAANALPRAVPATTLCEEKKQLRERLLGIKKYHKTTALMIVLSVILALLVAGCAAVLGPQMKQDVFTDPLTEEQQAPVLENIRAWAEENIEVDGELTVTYSEPNDNPQSMGSLVEIANVYLYDLSSNTVRPVDGIYPDSERLGLVTLTVKDGQTVRDIRTFYLTGGGAPQTPDPIGSLEQFAAAYPGATVKYISWEQRAGQPIYIKIFFNNEGREDIFEYSGVCGRWGVREKESVSDKRAVIPVEALPQMMERITQWQITNGGDADGGNFTLVNGMTLETPASHGILDQFLDDWETVQVYNMATGDLYRLEGNYTGAVEYGYFSLLNVEEPRKWVFLIDNNDKEPARPEPTPDLSGQVAVLVQNAALENAFAQTVDAEGRTVVMDMAMALKKGDLVWVESQEGTTCNVTVLAGDLPRVQGQLDVSLLSVRQTDLENANQVILQNAPQWSGPNEGLFAGLAVSGVANVEERRTVDAYPMGEDGTTAVQQTWYRVTLPGGGNPFWTRREDVVFEWPLPDPLPTWIPAEADPEAKITRWTYGESHDQPQIVILEVEDPPAHRAWAWDVFSGTVVELTARNTRKAGDLKVGQLPGVLNGLKGWLDENEPLWQADRTVTFMYQSLTGYRRNFPEKEPLLVYSLADGRVTRLEGDYTGSQNYGLLDITVNGSDTDRVYHLFIDDAPTAQPRPDLAGKSYYYEGGGFSGVGEFTLKLHEDGTFGYYEGLLSSHMGMGSWAVEGDILTLREDTFNRVFHFRVQEGVLYYMAENSAPFSYVKLEDGARFLEDTYTPAALRAYSEVLWEASLKGVLPDGQPLDWRGAEAAANNHFGVMDIDADGRIELLLSWTDASMAGHLFAIYDYQNGLLREQGRFFPSLRLYSNCVLEEDWSHNQGWSGRFWPYFAYCYDPVTDTYEEVGFVEGWDKQLQPKGFPDDIDADGDGLVYDVRVGEVTGSRYETERLMDGPAFEEWRQSYLNGAQQVEIELTPLTEENIAALGAPKPAAHTVQPMG